MSSPAELVGRKLGHYLIKEQIGAGGMGVVFLAHDERLERDVAIKVLPVSTFADQAVRKRFRKEALTLSKLNHPNIATIFDFNEENETCFLVTEYIAGPSVDIIVNAGALPESQIISLGLQLTDALVAAHEKGVVHCDLKPENLRLTPDGRLKVLDFGIARLMHTATDENMATMTMTMSQTNEIRGTLPYMAPEQLLGEPPDARTDIWATGAVLYQLSAGSRPFQGKVATALAAEIIHATPPQLSGLRKGLSPLLESTVMKCLEKKAEHRYQTARELKVDLDRVLTRQSSVPIVISAAGDVVPSEPPKKNPWKLIAIGVLVCLLTVGGWYWSHRHSSPVAKNSSRQSVAVLGFKNETANVKDDWISGILTTQLPIELAAGEKVRIVSEEDVNRARQDLSLVNASSLAQDTLARINRRLNSDLIVVGSYSNSEGEIFLNLYVQDTKAGETITSFAERGRSDEIEQLIVRTGINLRQKLGLDTVDAATAELMRASMPSNARAAQSYAEGVTKLRMSDALGARDLLQKAIGADPNYAMAHSVLSAAWDQLGYDEKKQDEAKRAYDLSGKLLREQKLLVEARYREATSEWDKAAEIYRALQSLAPDELDYGLRLASTQIRGGKAQGGLLTIQKLRALPPPERDDPRIDLAEAEAADALADFKTTKDATQRTIQKAQQTGARTLAAQASSKQCWALMNLGDLDNARVAGENALHIFKDASDQLGQARSLTCIANVLASKGDIPTAQSLHEQALALTQSIGAQRDSAGALINLANLFSDHGDFSGSVTRYKQALAICREIDDKVQTVLIENNLGSVYFTQGMYSQAGDAYELAHQLAKQSGDLQGLVRARMNLSIIRLQQGKIGDAKSGIQETIAVTKQMGDQSDNAAALQILGDILLAQDDLKGADTAYTDFLNIQNKLEQASDIATARLSLAGLELERAQATKAEDYARQAVAEFSAEKNADAEVMARSMLIKSLVQQQKTSEARSQADIVEKISTTDKMVGLDSSIQLARLLTQEKKYAESENRLNRAISGAAKMGLKGYELEARMVLAENQIAAGHRQLGMDTLRKLVNEAGRQGFTLTARKSDELVKATNKS